MVGEGGTECARREVRQSSAIIVQCFRRPRQRKQGRKRLRRTESQVRQQTQQTPDMPVRRSVRNLFVADVQLAHTGRDKI